MMTPENQKYFDDMEFLFGQVGWKNIIEDIQLRQEREKENALSNRMTAGDLAVSFGRNEVYQYILSLEATLAEVKRQLSEDE